MIILPNLGLKVWNLSTDPYNSTQLAENFQKLDDHDHAGGRGKQIPTGGIADGAITSAKMDPNMAIIPSDGTVTTAKLVDGSVTTPKIADAAVTSVKIADDGVTTTKVLDAAITAAKLATNAKIVTGSASLASNYTLTGSYTDVTGLTATFTPSVPSLLIGIGSITASVSATTQASSAGAADLYFDLDGSRSGTAASGGYFLTVSSGTASPEWDGNIPLITVASVTAASHTLKVRGRVINQSNSTAALISKADGANVSSGFRYFLLPT